MLVSQAPSPGFHPQHGLKAAAWRQRQEGLKFKAILICIEDVDLLHPHQFEASLGCRTLCLQLMMMGGGDEHGDDDDEQEGEERGERKRK